MVCPKAIAYVLLLFQLLLNSCQDGFAPSGDVQASATLDPTLPTDYTPAGLLYRGFPDVPLILYEIFAAWCPYCAWYHTEQLPALLEQYGRSGQIQFVLVDVTWERNQEVHQAAWCIGEQLGAEAHWQFWSDFYSDYDRWWERQDRVLKQLVKQAGVDPDAFQFCMDTQAVPWSQGIEVIGHQKLGDWHGTRVLA